MPKSPRRAFTMIELLVVITIIVVLLSIMLPVVGRAVYTAELLKCGTNLKAIATGSQVYATAQRMYFPYRATLDRGTIKRANLIVGGGQDDRPSFKDHVELKNLLDPMAGDIDLHPDATTAGEVYSNYALWFGMYFASPNGSGRMTRMGSRFSFNENPQGGAPTHTFKVLASDWDAFQKQSVEKVHASHPDDDGMLSEIVEQNENNRVRSQWQSTTNSIRGPIDTQYVYDDGSVEKFEAVPFYETNAADPTFPIGKQRMVRVPVFANNSQTTDDWVHLPAK